MEKKDWEEERDLVDLTGEEETSGESYWGRNILSQAVVSLLVVVFLFGLGRLPGIGQGLLERFRLVLVYEKELAPADSARRLNETWRKVSSWFGGEVREALAPPRMEYSFNSPVAGGVRQAPEDYRLGFLVPAGTDVAASASGLVREIIREEEGWKIRIDHSGDWSTVYYPTLRPFVVQGQWVKSGEVIGRSGADPNRGKAFYWEVWYGKSRVNPQPLLKMEGSGR